MSRDRGDTCRDCKRTAACQHVVGIGELCDQCRHELEEVGDLIELADGMQEVDLKLWRSTIRCLQKLSIDYTLNGESGTRTLHVQGPRGRLNALKEAVKDQREFLDELFMAWRRFDDANTSKRPWSGA